MPSPTSRAAVLLAGLLLSGVTGAALAQTAAEPRAPLTGRSVTATGQTKPPTPGQLSASSQAQMQKAQRAARDRDKAWDAKMNRTMGSICKGC